MNRRHLSWLLGALLTALLAVPATWLLFTQFMVYDDEGYVLWSLKSYVETGALYTKVYSQYGPAFFTAYDAFHRLTGFAFTNENARWITLALWCGAAYLAGSIAAMLTRSILARLATIALTFAALAAMASEPSHPGGPLAFFSALAAWCGCQALLRNRPRWLALGCGALGAAMLLTKINVGLFLLIAVGSWLVLNGFVDEAHRRRVGLVIVLGCVAAPLLLMRGQLGDAAYAEFALRSAASAAALAILLRATSRGEHTPRDWSAFVGAVVLVVAIVSLAVVARGTSWRDLLHGVVVAPLRQTVVYAFAPRPAMAATLLALAGLGGAAWLAMRRELSPGVARAIAWGRLAAFVAVAVIGLVAPEQSVSRQLFHFGAALAWLFAWPLRDANSPASRARRWLAWIFIWQTLHAFPVAGSQVAWGSCLGAALVVTGAWEAIAILFAERRTPALAAGALALGVSLAPCVALAQAGWAFRQTSAAVDLPGARRLLLPPNIALDLRTMSRNATLHGDMLFSHPGMFSFNLWTGLPTPTTANVTLWSTLLSDAQQREIRTRLAADPRAIVISQDYVLRHLIAQGFAPRGALNDFLVDRFVPAFRVDTYVFWVHRGRTIAPIGTAHRDAAPDGSGWEIEFITDASGHAATWELRTNVAPRLIGRGEIGADHTTVEFLNEDGTTTSNARSLADAPLPGRLCRVMFSIPPLKLPSVDDLELRVLDADGRTLERVPFRR